MNAATIAIREVLASGLFEALAGAPDLAGVPFERSLVRALGMRETRVVVAVTLGDDVAQELVGATNWDTELLVHVVTQDDEPDRLADRYLVLLHPIVMGYRHERLIATDVTKIESPLYAEAGGSVCVRTARYRMQYQTRSNSLT